jgi:hypothetical protein
MGATPSRRSHLWIYPFFFLFLGQYQVILRLTQPIASVGMDSWEVAQPSYSTIPSDLVDCADQITVLLLYAFGIRCLLKGPHRYLANLTRPAQVEGY